MGFLLGAYGKLAAGSRMRSIQARLMRIQSRLRRATRDVANMEKMIDRQQKSMEQGLTLQNNQAKQLYQGAMYTAMLGTAGEDGITVKDAMTKMQGKDLSNEDVQKYSAIVSTAQSQFSQQISSMNAYCDTQTAMSKQQIENYIENLRDTMLEPLKDEEDSLQLEQDTLKSQLEIASNDYKACQEMEKNDAKMLAPSYTAGGQG